METGGTLMTTKPRAGTHRADILAALRRGEKLTQIDAINRGYGWRLSAHIYALRWDHGWGIETTDVYRGKGGPIAEYHLPAGGVSYDVPCS